MKKEYSKGFSLVEIAAVITIIALLAIGVTMGGNLLRQTELRSIISENANFQEAIDIFEETYKGLPGDLFNAQDIWGLSVTSNGNGNGKVDSNNENFYAWQHLQLAGLISGDYTGAAINGGAEIGSNVPKSNFRNGGWSIQGDSDFNLSSGSADGQYLQIGAFKTSDLSVNPIMTPDQAYILDQKIDDGVPRAGFVYVEHETTPSASTCYGSSSSYNRSLSSDLCTLKLLFRRF